MFKNVHGNVFEITQVYLHFLNSINCLQKLKMKQCPLGISGLNRVDRVCVVVGSWTLEIGS